LWADPDRARAVGQELSQLRTTVDGVDALARRLDDLEVMMELAAESPDGIDLDDLGDETRGASTALAELETNVATQEAELDEATRAHQEAEAELVDAIQAVADAQLRIEDLNRRADELVVQAFVSPPSDNALDAFRADSLSDASVKQAVIEIQADTDADLLDQLDEAHEDMEVQQANETAAEAAAEARRAEAAQELADVEAALAQQQDFAADLEERLNAKLAEAESLKEFDKALSDRLVREQAEVARRIRAMQEAAERQRRAQEAAARAAAARAAAAANEPPPPASAPDSAPRIPAAPPASVVTRAPGGLATVTCPHGGSITVAGSIADNVQALLNAAARDGVSLCARSGWRSTEKQIQLRREHCGSSNYAIYYMPASRCSPPTARPGTSNHERGLAIDFSCNGGGAITRGNECWDWLVAHAGEYGLYNLPSEPWHWSTNGR